ncbi:MAG: Hsp20/alpha crystallin family protein [Candidatus Bathyarchaeota archaeon]
MSFDFFDELSRVMWDLTRKSLEPLTNISETEDKVIVEVDLPLVKKKDVQLRLTSNGLEIEASLQRCMKFERWGTIQRSCEFKTFYKMVALPSLVISEGAKATFTKGILKIELKKIRTTEHKIYIE